ncbi:MAG: SH3 domain-containing protein [Paracoccaceae bacterium]
MTGWRVALAALIVAAALPAAAPPLILAQRSAEIPFPVPRPERAAPSAPSQTPEAAPLPSPATASETETPPETAALPPLPDPTVGPVTNLPLPRFVSLNAREINVRRGPGLDYRRDWVFRRQGLPVRVTDEYGGWRRIEDADGAGGWVFHALISGRRTVLVTTEGALLRRDPSEPGPWTGACSELTAAGVRASACLERGVVARLRECAPELCLIEARGQSGWVPKSALWGVAAQETFGD